MGKNLLRAAVVALGLVLAGVGAGSSSAVTESGVSTTEKYGDPIWGAAPAGEAGDPIWG
ncbi:hypothetical protein [Streptomyces sp. NPDC003635]